MEKEHLDIDREQEANEYANAQPNFDLTVARESLVPNFKTGIETLIEGVVNGEINSLDVYATFKKLEKLFSESKVKIETYAMEEADKYDKSFELSGVKFTKKDGSKSVQTGEDLVVIDLQEKLKERQELVKLATKSKEDIFDSEGVKVDKVSIKHGKESLTVKF